METIFILKITESIILSREKMELQVLFSAHYLMMIYICSNFHENIFDGFLE